MTIAAPLARSIGRRARLWLALAALVAVGAVIVTALSRPAGQPLDPNSAAPSGSAALARLLTDRGVVVHRSTSVAAAAAAAAEDEVLIAFPGALSVDELRQLVASGHRIVAIAPDADALAALPAGIVIDSMNHGLVEEPRCGWADGSATGPVEFPDDTINYRAEDPCYGGAAIVEPKIAVLGSAGLLQNDHLADQGVAALDINAISNDGEVTTVDWLTTGSSDAGPAVASVWDLFPPFAQRAFWWLLFVLVLTVLWRGRRLGPVVREPLPVVVRAAEVVEGHGRLYRRAHARDRTAAALRSATAVRLVTRLGLPRGSSADTIAPVLAPLSGRPAVEIRAWLGGPPPDSDADLLVLARALSALERSIAVRSPTSRPGPERSG